MTRDCFAEPVIGPAKGRTRWLAMTLIVRSFRIRAIARYFAPICWANSSSACAAKARMLARRSALPVRRVKARCDGPGDRDAGVAGRIAVAVARRPGGAGFGEPPGGVQPLADTLRQERGIRLARRPHPFGLHVVEADAGETPARRAGVDHGAAHEISRGAGHRKQ